MVELVRTRQWVVAQTQPNRENWAAKNVKMQGREFYLPKMLVRKGATETVRPLFPRYLFVQITDGQWHFLTGTFGVSRLVSTANDGSPNVIADRHIDELRSREDSNGIIRLPTIDDDGRFRPGQRVRVRSGLLEGQTGIYEGMGARGREKVLMAILGQKTVILFAHTDLEEERGS